MSATDHLKKKKQLRNKIIGYLYILSCRDTQCSRPNDSFTVCVMTQPQSDPHSLTSHFCDTLHCAVTY